MNTKELKSRAKRLRTAIQTMFDISVGHSQALELVAKEENYPNWDAACACHTQIPAATWAQPPLQQLEVTYSPKPDFSNVFAQAPKLGEDLRQFFRSPAGGLVLLGAGTMKGLTTTVGTLAEEALRHGHFLVDLYQTGPQERSYAPGVNWHCLSRETDIRRIATRDPSLILIDDLRDEKHALQALSMAKMDFKVVIALNATDPLLRIKTLIENAGWGMVKADLSGINCIASIHQHVDYSSADHAALVRRRMANITQQQ